MAALFKKSGRERIQNFKLAVCRMDADENSTKWNGKYLLMPKSSLESLLSVKLISWQEWAWPSVI